MLTQFSLKTLRWLAAGFVLAAVPAIADEHEGVVRLSAKPSAGVVRISDAAAQTVVRGQSPNSCLPANAVCAPVGSSCTPNGCVPDGSSCLPGGGSSAACRHGVPRGYSCPQCAAAPWNNFDYGYGYNAGGGPHNCPTNVYGNSFGTCGNGGNCGTGSGCWNLHPAIANGAMSEWLRQVGSVYYNQARSHAEQECREKHEWMKCKFGYFVPTGNCGTGVTLIGHYNMVYPVDPSYFDQRDGQVYAAQGYGGPVSVPLAPVVNHTFNYGWGVPSSRLTPVSHPTYPPRP